MIVRAHHLAFSVFTSLLFGFVVGCTPSSTVGVPGGNAGSSPTPAVTKIAIPDTSNNRVLIYAPPYTTNENATIVLGQPDFTSSSTGITAASLAVPAYTAYDRAGNLFVSDMGNCRVLEYKAPLRNGMSALVVFGQTDFTSNSCGPASAVTLDSPSGVAVDSQGNLWVSDSNHGRVLEYVPQFVSNFFSPFTNNVLSFTSGMPATLAIGRPDLTSGGPCGLPNSVKESTLCEPLAIAFDPNGNLWVADTNDNRVLEFKPPFSTGMSASVALGQPDLTSGGQCGGGPATDSTLCGPLAIAFDPSGNLWVADSNNHRVLKFSPPFSNGMPANVVLGQTAFTSNSANQGGSAGSGTMNAPQGVLFDSTGRLFVGDTGNNRTLVFDGPFSNGMNATAALGQPDLASGSANQGGSPSAATQNAPLGAGPSWIALLTLAVLIAIWAMWRRKRRMGSMA
jgi:sugar lactone lactonase YvrE